MNELSKIPAPADQEAVPGLQFTLKVSSRCNLACTYCYVYEKGDESWRDRPGLMPDKVFRATVERIREHCIASGQKEIDIVFHGGEPCLLGLRRFETWCDYLHERLGDVGTPKLTLQTNAVLIDDDWAEMLARQGIIVGISIDGPAHIHDVARIDKKGSGSHADVVAGIGCLGRAGLPINLLCVVQLGADPLEVHEHMVELGAKSINYLMPDQTHETIAAVRRQFGSTPCADFLNPVMDHWLDGGDYSLTVQPFKAMARTILGGHARVDFLGNNPYRFVFIEADGSVEGLDVLRVCAPGLAVTSLNVFENSFVDILDRNSLHRQMIFEGLPLPSECHECPEASTCAGGYVPHRWSDGHFDNRSAWCDDLLAIYTNMRERLDVPAEETLIRRSLLKEMREEAATQCI